MNLSTRCLRGQHLLSLTLLLLLSACDSRQSTDINGYIEADFAYAAARSAGRLDSLAVHEGDQVQQNQLLFQQETTGQQLTVQAAEAALAEAKAERQNLLSGARTPEINAQKAKIAGAVAEVQLAKAEYRRYSGLVGSRAVSRNLLDQSHRTLKSAQASLATLKAELINIQQAARPDRIAAATAAVTRAEAELGKANWQQEQRSGLSPVSGTVQEILYRPGEFVTSGQPVVKILPQDMVKVCFYVPESRLAEFKTGQKVTVRGDGGINEQATVSFISTQAEYTPPVLYTEEKRTKLRFEVEAKLPAGEHGQRLHPGLPVTVQP